MLIFFLAILIIRFRFLKLVWINPLEFNKFFSFKDEKNILIVY